MSKWMPDGAGSRARIGVLTPHMDAVPESEFQALAPNGVSIHSARVPLGMVGPNGEIIPHVDADIATAFVSPPVIDDAASLLAAVTPSAIVIGFTSSSYILGGVRLKRTGLRKPAIRRTSCRRKFAPLGEGGGAIELEILAAVEVAFLVEVVVY